MALALLVQIVLARMIGKDGYGEYVYAFSWIVLLTILANFGAAETGTRFVASFKSRKQWLKLRRMVRLAGTISFATSILVTCAILLAANYILPAERKNLRHLLNIGALIVPFSIGIRISSGYMRGDRKILLSLFPERILQPLVFILIFALFFIVGNTAPDSADAMVARLMATIFVCISALALYLREVLKIPKSDLSIKKTNSKEHERKNEVFGMKAWFGVATYLFAISGMAVIFNRSDSIMIGLLIGEEDVGVYYAASRIAAMLGFFLTASNSIAGPMIAELHGQKKIEELQNTLSVAVRIVSVLTGLSFLVLVFFGKPILGLFGDDFAAGWIVLMVCSIGHLINAFSGSVNLVMTMTGHQAVSAKIFALTAASNIILNLVLIPLVGVVGAAIATSCAYVSYNVSCIIYVKKHLKIDTTILGGAKFA